MTTKVKDNQLALLFKTFPPNYIKTITAGENVYLHISEAGVVTISILEAYAP